jgi:neopullulanase
MQISTAEGRSQTELTPSWVRDAVFYQIFPDRFAKSDRVPKPSNLEAWDAAPTVQGFKGGDLLGIVEHLDYLQDLGVTALYLCPIFRSTANHRYHTHDYFSVDPILGGDEAFKTLLREVHARGMRLILDGVFNHCGRSFFQFAHILENGGNSPYLDWFSIYEWPLHPYGPSDAPAGYACWWNDRALPEFNTRTQAVREFLWEVGEHWIRLGADGWRLDVPNEIDDDDFWREFRRRVKRANPDAYIVGEIWGDARRWLAGDQFDAVMNYPFTRACLGFFSGSRGIDEAGLSMTGLKDIALLDAEGFKAQLETLLGAYPWHIDLSQLNMLGTHDTPRYLSTVDADESSLRLALLFQATFPGAPCIYYGDEIGMSGALTVEAARAGFPWDPSLWNAGLRNHVKACIQLRKDNEVLRRGDFRTLCADGGVYVFARTFGGTVAIMALNAEDQERNIEVPLPEDLHHLGDARPLWGNAGQLTDFSVLWRVPGRSGHVLLARFA